MRSTLLLAALAGLTRAAEPTIVALGSSYAHGLGLSKAIGGYVQDSLSAHFDTQYNFTNLAQDGSMLNAIGDTQTPQIKSTQPALIYLSSGGNDLYYVACLYNSASLSTCSNPISYEDWKTRFEKALDAVVRSISNPADVPIYIVDYLPALGPATNCSSSNPACPLNASAVAEIEVIYNDVVTWTHSALDEWWQENAASNYNTILIPMREYGAGHEVGTSDPWVNGANGGVGAWHPTAAGAQAVAGYIVGDYIANYGSADC
ncbi:hypothetical protein AMS68_007522 [Peltaster fructicola]|uniref:SGNH hydrolase-type esterase domain-containing protein n=1 Tax=Peltaster fructicola TaxID=286661 RepID=A0A6H0Y522_9PEZI|nr:hypothetical protein AMS68_007522 [Peltaster fructicola]